MSCTCLGKPYKGLYLDMGSSYTFLVDVVDERVPVEFSGGFLGAPVRVPDGGGQVLVVGVGSHLVHQGLDLGGSQGREQVLQINI